MGDHLAEWARCRPWILSAIEVCGGTHAIEDIERGLAENRYQVWFGEHVVVVTEVNSFPQMKTLHCFLIGGDGQAIDELVSKIEPELVKFARFFKCKRITGIGRKGFERVFKASGFEPRWFCISKDIPE